MTDSLRDQLLGLGFKPAPKPERPPGPRGPSPRQGNAANRGRGDALGGPRRPDAPSHAKGKPARTPPAGHKPHQGAGRARTREDIDLAKAYAIRAQREKDERIEAERVKQEQARQRREAKARLADMLKGKSLNDPDADIARHFEYGGKIKRIHVNAGQLKSLNAGALGVVQLDGRYLLVDAATLDQAAEVFPPAVALRIDPSAPAGDDPYADPQYQVPDDLVW
jgi:uncharacterized protein YaiL (DUF2058 family)